MSGNATCSNNNQCSGYGYCVNEHCSCIPLYGGDYCEIKLVDTSPELYDFFWIYCYVYAVLFFGVAVISVMQFALTVKDKGWKNMTKVTITLYCLLFLVGIVRAFFLLFDPYDYRGMVGPVGFRLLFGFPIACLLGLYILIILLWINTYNALNYQKALDRVFRHAWVVITILFIVEFTYDLLNGFYGAGTVDFITLAVYIAFVGLGTLTLAILFLIYSRKLYRRLTSVKSNVQNLKKK